MTEPVGIIMGSQSDWPTMREAATILDELGVAWSARIVSARMTTHPPLGSPGAGFIRSTV